ncbi:MAG: NAD-dependent dehydratase [Firmicutes bacterium HGW-Firmicutes-15]|nr:MAG: NAD-dependent dehydratase [Firmicutes bacterium HGW-Firmicutes-15]
MNLKNKKILVTGADGFIGSHLSEELVRTGHNVRALVLYNSFNSWGWLDEAPPDIQDNLEVFAGDVRDPHGVKEAMQGCDVVIHLAALVAIPYSYHSPDTYLDTNIKGTLNILQAARHLDIEKVVCTSTSEVYGTARYVPIDEEHPLQGQSPYAATKIAADQMAIAFNKSFATPVAIIRPFNTYGPRQSARAVIPTVITQIASGQRVIKLGAVHPTRDFNYIKDTVRGFMAVAKSDNAVGEVINIGSNYEISIGGLVELIAEIMQVKVEIQTEQERLRPEKSEVERLWADNSKARGITGWKPEYGGHEGFKRGLTETITWFSDMDNLKKYRAGTYNL